MKTPEQVAHHVTSNWIQTRMRIDELERLIALAIRVDRLEIYDSAARIALDWTDSKDRSDYDTLSAAMAISNAIRAKAKEVSQ